MLSQYQAILTNVASYIKLKIHRYRYGRKRSDYFKECLISWKIEQIYIYIYIYIYIINTFTSCQNIVHRCETRSNNNLILKCQTFNKQLKRSGKDKTTAHTFINVGCRTTRSSVGCWTYNQSIQKALP